ncbi:MAG TPA: phospholipase D-like domain-containing protein [Candidatus Thermoplasmatota archaeon]|nr:phospholipase D-like domain-containing protein [Candidatus Thermoplasmatota archaeon]
MTQNVGTSGRVLDETGRPLAGLLVSVHNRNLMGPDDLLGTAFTDPEGRYDVRYPPEAYTRFLVTRPDLQVTIHDAAGIRFLAATEKVPSVGAEVQAMPDLTVPRAYAYGWLVTVGEAEPTCLSMGNDVAFLVDGEAAFAALTEAVDRAQRSVYLTQFMFEPDFETTFEEGPANGRRLVDALLDADARGVDVRVLIRETPVLRDSSTTLPTFFAKARDGAHNIRIQTYPLPLHTLHAKAVVVDGEEAFLIGQPFEQRYWDTRAHHAEELRRAPGRPPLHDVSIRLRGPAAGDVGAFVAELWNCRQDHDPMPEPTRPGPVGRHAVQIVRTVPPSQLPRREGGEFGILEAYERAFAAAEQFVYIETQYFTSGAITEALLKALRKNPDLEAILVLNTTVDVPTYISWQNRRVRELLHPDVRGRVGVFTLASMRGSPQPPTPIYVHSKASVVDDRWATVGSANLDGISLESAYEFGLQNKCNLDLNAVVFDGTDGLTPATGAVRGLRCSLWAEHLGCTAKDVAERPPGGWLRPWREAAELNQALLVKEQRLARGFVLPYLEHELP